MGRTAEVPNTIAYREKDSRLRPTQLDLTLGKNMIKCPIYGSVNIGLCTKLIGFERRSSRTQWDDV